MRKTLLALSMAFAAGVSAETFMPWTDVMKTYDANHDGGVSMEETKDHKLGQTTPGFAPWFADHFAELDTNGDGIVNQDELSKMMHTKQWTDKDMVNFFYKDTGFMPTNPANR